MLERGPAMELWCPVASMPPHQPSSTGGMYHGDMTEKLKALYKLHLPPGEPPLPFTSEGLSYKSGGLSVPGHTGGAYRGLGFVEVPHPDRGGGGGQSTGAGP